VTDYPLERVSAITWVPAEKIMGRPGWLQPPTGCAPPPCGRRPEHQLHPNARALISLVAITGNIDVKGGNLLPTPLEGYILLLR